MPALRITITGHVQGVFFRAEAKRRADELGITGWVRNYDDGSVEIHAEGTEEALRSLEQWCQRGSPSAEVTAVRSVQGMDEGHRSFVIKR